MTDTENHSGNHSGENEENTSENDHLEDVDLSDATLESVDEAESAEDTKKQLEAALLQSKENHELYLRALADFENFKKRSIKERSDLIKYQGERIFQDLLEVTDNFERALEVEDSQEGDFKTGIEMILKQFNALLAKFEVRAESALGANFDPTKHSALSQVEDDSAEPGTVLSELKKAYYYKDKLLRAAEVVVCKAKNI